MMISNTQAIWSQPDILGGTPVFVGTRVPFKILFDYLESGENIPTFLADFPSVKQEQVQIALSQIQCA